LPQHSYQRLTHQVLYPTLASLLITSFTNSRYTLAPLDFESYVIIGYPWLGASRSRTFRGIIDWHTLSCQYLFNSSITRITQFGRASSIVIRAPWFCRPVLKCF